MYYPYVQIYAYKVVVFSSWAASSSWKGLYSFVYK